MSQLLYVSTVRSLIFAKICTTSDNAHVIGIVSWYIIKPSREHWNVVKRILIYIKGTFDIVLCYGRLDFIGKEYVDSNYICDLDKSKSTTIYVFTLVVGAISWVSKL